MLNKLRRYRWIILGRWKIKKQIRAAAFRDKMKIIIGSGGTDYSGWIATDLPHFDILKKSHWEYFFKNYKIDNLLAEHVLEHLTEDQVSMVISNARNYLKNNGRFRIAVPDGFHPNPTYIDYVSPMGKIGADHGHQFLWNYQLLSACAIRAGFTIELLEYYTKDKVFHISPYSFDNGFIGRSKKNNYINDHVTEYTSLIADLVVNNG